MSSRPVLWDQQFKEIGNGGYLHEWDIDNIYKEVYSLQPKENYLEIGVAFGQSFSIAALAAHMGVSVYGIDRLNWEKRDENIRKFLEMNGAGDKPMPTFIEGDSANEAKYWSRGPINLLFIDGDHTYEGVVKDMVSWLPWVDYGGMILFDDYNERTGVKQAVDELIYDHECYTEFRVDHEMFICKKI